MTLTLTPQCDERGYDLVPLPSGGQVRVFTKPEFRVTFQANSLQPRQTVPAHRLGKPRPPPPRKGGGAKHGGRSNGSQGQGHRGPDTSTPVSEFTSCLRESMRGYG